MGYGILEYKINRLKLQRKENLQCFKLCVQTNKKYNLIIVFLVTNFVHNFQINTKIYIEFDRKTTFGKSL